MNRRSESDVNSGSAIPMLSQYYTITDEEIGNRTLWHTVNQNPLPSQVLTPGSSYPPTPCPTPRASRLVADQESYAVLRFT
jgi:hypothetical protein